MQMRTHRFPIDATENRIGPSWGFTPLTTSLVWSMSHLRHSHAHAHRANVMVRRRELHMRQYSVRIRHSNTRKYGKCVVYAYNCTREQKLTDLFSCSIMSWPLAVRDLIGAGDKRLNNLGFERNKKNPKSPLRK